MCPNKSMRYPRPRQKAQFARRKTICRADKHGLIADIEVSNIPTVAGEVRCVVKSDI